MEKVLGFMSRNSLTFSLFHGIIRYKLKGVNDMAVGFGKVYPNDDYVYIDLDRLHKRIMMSRLQSAGGSISINEHITPCKDEFLIMNTGTLEVIKKYNEVVKNSYGSDPDADFLFGVPIVICDTLDFGFIKVVNSEY